MAKWSRHKGKMRRSYLKRFSEKSTFSSDFTGAKARAAMLSKPGEFGGSILYRDHVKPGTSGHPTPETKTKYLMLQNYLGVPDERVPPIIVVLRRLASVESEMGEWHQLKVEDAPYEKLYMFFKGDKSFFMEENQIECVIRRSINYSSDRGRFILHQRTRHIVWRDVYKLENPNPSPD